MLAAIWRLSCYLLVLYMECESGGIGRRTRLRIWRGNPWGFESPLSHQRSLGCARDVGCGLTSAMRLRFPPLKCMIMNRIALRLEITSRGYGSWQFTRGLHGRAGEFARRTEALGGRR